MTDNDNTPVTAADLAEFDEIYKNADVGDDEFEPVPDGKYQAVVDRVELTRTSKGDPMLKWTLRILGPTHAGRLLWRNNVLAGPRNVEFLRKDLHRCGLFILPTELPTNLDRLLDLRLNISKKTKGDFDSIYINSRITTAAEAETKDAPAAKSVGKPRGKAREALSKF